MESRVKQFPCGRFEESPLKPDTDPSSFRFGISVALIFRLVSSWATLQCRPGRHCCVVVGDIALELCTGQKEPNIAPTAVPGSGQHPISLPPYSLHRNPGFGAKPRLIAALELCTKKEIKKKTFPPPPTPSPSITRVLAREAAPHDQTFLWSGSGAVDVFWG